MVQHPPTAVRATGRSGVGLHRSCAASGREGKSESKVMDFHRLVERVRAEFREMPGLQLTPAQASRLLGIEPEACLRVIDALVSAAFLRRTAVGTIVLGGE